MDMKIMEKIMAETKKMFILESRNNLNLSFLVYLNYCSNPTEPDRATLENFFHSVKGSAGISGFNNIADIARSYENFFKGKQNKNGLSNTEKIYVFNGFSEIINLLNHLHKEHFVTINDEMTIASLLNQIKPEKEIDLYKNTTPALSNTSIDNWSVAEHIPKYGNVLIIDDDIVILDYLDKNLTAAGYKTFITSNADEVLLIIMSKAIDLILIDVMMPNKNGFEIFENIKRYKYDGGVIFLSSRDMTNDKVNGLNLGADDYITKPFNIEELFARMERIIKTRVTVRAKLNKDELTNAYTRGCFYDNYRRALENLENNKKRFSIALVDIEDFKEINRNNGYFVGDIVLKRFCDELVSNLRGEMIFRLESDIFLILFEQTEAEESQKILEKILTQLGEKEFTPLTQPLSFVSTVYTIKNHYEKLEDVLVKLYESLDKSKTIGNNKISLVAKESDIVRKVRIMIIEDVSVTIYLIKKRMEEIGYEVFYSTDGVEAINKLKTVKPDIIILDLMLPKIDGFELCKIIRDNHTLENTKIIVLSSKNDPEDIQRCYTLGVDDFVSKPFSVDSLEKRISRLLKFHPLVVTSTEFQSI